MKNFLTTLVFLLITVNFAKAQNVPQCEKIVALTYKAVNEKNSELIDDYLSADFSTAGYDGEMAKIILKQLIIQLNNKVEKFVKIKEVNNEYLTLEYEADFSEIGKQKSTFVFDKNNKLRKLELVKTEVKK